MLCPYCVNHNADSRDHVFTDFLGGKAWGSACSQCNNTFGHTIEAAALSHLRDLMFFLRRAGMKPPKPMVWKGIGFGPGGQRYDVDQDLKATPSKPMIERDTAGRIVRATGSRRHVDQIQGSLARNGRSSRIVAEPIEIDLRQLKMTFPMDDDIKRLCIKMSIAAPHLLGAAVELDSGTRRYLLEGLPLDVCPVRIALNRYVELDQQRPLVGHLIYVRAASSERRLYSIVPPFSSIVNWLAITMDRTGRSVPPTIPSSIQRRSLLCQLWTIPYRRDTSLEVLRSVSRSALSVCASSLWLCTVTRRPRGFQPKADNFCLSKEHKALDARDAQACLRIQWLREIAIEIGFPSSADFDFANTPHLA
jgi:hypothetical protein